MVRPMLKNMITLSTCNTIIFYEKSSLLKSSHLAVTSSALQNKDHSLVNQALQYFLNLK